MDVAHSGRWLKRTAIGMAVLGVGIVIVVMVMVARSLMPQPPPRETRLPITRGAPWEIVDNPANDGWASEAFHLRAKTQLAALGELLTHSGAKLDAAALAELVSDDFSCSALRPDGLTSVLDDEIFVVERGPTQNPNEQPAPNPLPFRGPSGFVDALRSVMTPLAQATHVRCEFKVFDVQLAPGEVSTRLHVAMSGRTHQGAVEQHAIWRVLWSSGDGGLPPRMRSIRVVDFEQTATRHTSGALFSDCTASVLGKNPCYQEQLLWGMNHWLGRNQDRRYFALLGNPGLAVGDVNGDGLDDLYLCQEAGLPNRLFVQNPDGSARDVSVEWGVDWVESSRSALLVDLDNDSDQDLVVAILGGVVVAENDGKGNFELRDVLPSGDDTMSLSAVDYDLDGRLDLYACIYYQDRGLDNPNHLPLPGAAAGFVAHDANDGGSNSLWRNEISADRSWVFRNVTRETGLDANNDRYSFAAAWDDFDNDGDQDLYVANDYGRDNFYRNQKASTGEDRFVDVAEAARVEDSAAGMSITCGDYDRDGWMDVYISNMWSAAGQRVTRQQQFKPDVLPEIKRRYQRLARGNTLLRNEGEGTFSDRSGPAGVEMGRWAWGSHFIDVNNDGWEDIVVSNGYLTTEDTGDL